ncbi:chorismate--pyruvate lyase family protein [Pollutimonas harenae]|uniref:Probable chorismate pyruvate-lyase n=1 Tax=Pollutimonas harenae TaxID=657015 RepID=A0A853H1E3_9BURK|nr:chorismate lyase [Pollutimonas harenae]NYT86122.1 chorismate lyase [Pollutimonas harenae]TEA71163.1 chorismate lyase [Pollutimonas harenae]
MELQPTYRSTWKSNPLPCLSRPQRHWLFRPGALTAGLRQLGQVQLRVINEQAIGLHPAEAWMLQRDIRSPIWVREIMMSIDGIDSVFARSFTPLSASHGLWQGMRRLRSRPLADMLYHNPQIIRSPFLACRLHSQNPLYGTAQRIMGSQRPPAHKLLARCSVFWRGGEPLLVAECFMPEFWALAAKSAYAQGLDPAKL